MSFDGLQRLLQDSGCEQERERGRDQSGLSQTRQTVSSRQESRRQKGRREVQRDQRSQRSAGRSGQARKVRYARRELSPLPAIRRRLDGLGIVLAVTGGAG